MHQDLNEPDPGPLAPGIHYTLQIASSLEQDETLGTLCDTLLESELESLEHAIEAVYGVPNHAYEICLRFVDAKESASLNQNYRDKNKPTNVLSFSSGLDQNMLDDNTSWPLGDLVLCHDVLCEESSAQKKTQLHHTLHLITHGTLHLLGYDHEIATEAEEMEALEVRILKALSINNPYENLST